MSILDSSPAQESRIWFTYVQISVVDDQLELKTDETESYTDRTMQSRPEQAGRSFNARIGLLRMRVSARVD